MAQNSNATHIVNESWIFTNENPVFRAVDQSEAFDFVSCRRQSSCSGLDILKKFLSHYHYLFAEGMLMKRFLFHSFLCFLLWLWFARQQRLPKILSSVLVGDLLVAWEVNRSIFNTDLLRILGDLDSSRSPTCCRIRPGKKAIDDSWKSCFNMSLTNLQILKEIASDLNFPFSPAWLHLLPPQKSSSPFTVQGLFYF